MVNHEFHNTTYMAPLGAVVILLMVFATLMVPRRYALVPLLVVACFVSPAQRITFVGIDMNSVRLIILAGWIRVFTRGELVRFRWHAVDSAFLAWAVSATLVFAAKWGFGALIARTGSHLYEQFLAYLLVRALVWELDDIVALVRAAALIAVPCAGFFMLEWHTARNVFSIFGGVPEHTIIRAGRLRCQGAFPHPIIAGVFWATWTPLIASLWFWSKSNRWMVPLGVAASTTIVIASASSTPLLALMGAWLAFLMFPLRHYMRYIRWGILFTAIGLHMVMEKPVWHLIARVSAVGGSTGYHRFKLIDNCIHHFSDWFLMGTSTTGWGGVSQQDVANFYVVQAVSGGLVTLVLFIALLSYAYRQVGRGWRAIRNDRPRSRFVWGIGAMLFAHTMAFVGLSYYGQAQLLWGMHAGFIGALVILVPVVQRVAQTDPYSPAVAVPNGEADPSFVAAVGAERECR